MSSDVDGPESTAIVQNSVSHPYGGGDQAVEVTRTPFDDTHWLVAREDYETPVNGVIVVEWDMKVENSVSTGGNGPFLGVRAFEGFSATNYPFTIGSLGVDALTREILYQSNPNGYFEAVEGIQVDNQWHQFRMALDYDHDLYQLSYDGQPILTEPFVDSSNGTIDSLTDVDIAAIATGDDAASQAAEGVAYFDNFVVVNFARVDGDYDVDGDVDLNDYLVWQANYGATTIANSGADGNGDGVVDAADYTVWRDNYSPSMSAVAATPEPTTLATAVCGLLIAGRRRSR
ncbi:hypothetical protein [Posidoniimonas polymericola]|uniref:hypothetical protein n=1 Tax=Posidoniimonas polymericola TaxID=2528002 RepID=UPI0011B6B856|nr:hypothetical protein [Posidoniimonas polymericola]